MASFNHEHFRCNFQNWITQQHQDLDELVRPLPADSAAADDDEDLKQMVYINALHCKTNKAEDKFAAKIALILEEISDEPLATIAKSAGRVGEWSGGVERAVAAQSERLAEVVEEADMLRMETLKEVMGILMPLQAADLLIAIKKLHISIH